MGKIPTTVSVFGNEEYLPAYAYYDGDDEASWSCECDSATSQRKALYEVLCGDDGLQYKNNDHNWA